MEEGFTYVGKVPGFLLLLWFVLYLSWLLVAGRTLFRALRLLTGK